MYEAPNACIVCPCNLLLGAARFGVDVDDKLGRVEGEELGTARQTSPLGQRTLS